MCGSKNRARFLGILVLGAFLLLMHREAPAQFKILSDGFSAWGGIASSPTLILVASGGQTQAIGTDANPNFVLTAGFIPTIAPGISIPNISRVVRVVNTSTSPGITVSVPIELDAQGDENALGFSLSFDPTILGNPQIARGRDADSTMLITNTSQVGVGKLGIALALNPGQAFAVGTRQIILASFTVNANTSADSAAILFDDQPIAREVSDTSATAVTADFVSGKVMIIRGLEADVSPRTMGDGAVTMTDWSQVGRFAAGLDTARTEVNEFQRADCAPRDSSGTGTLTIADWVQAGRYAAGLDTLRPAGGPTRPKFTSIFVADADSAGAETTAARNVRVINTAFKHGQKDTLTIEFDAQGDENALGFSLNFDPNILTFDTATLGNGDLGATLNVNANQKASGRIGIALALPIGQKFVAGIRQIVVMVFSVNANTPAATTTINFGDQSIVREIVDVNANTLSTTWTPGVVTIEIPTSVKSNADKVPSSFELAQNYPNPFNPETTIQYALPKQIGESVHVTLRIYNLQGQVVRTLVDGQQSPGHYRVIWDGKNDASAKISSGVYLYIITAGDFKTTKRMTILK